MFGRKRGDSGEGTDTGAQPAAVSAIPDYGFNQAATSSLSIASELERTSCYPVGMEGNAKFTGHARTTSYRQTRDFNRRTYDTIN